MLHVIENVFRLGGDIGDRVVDGGNVGEGEADDLDADLDDLEDARGDLQGGAEIADDVLVLQVGDLLWRCLDGRMVIRVKT